MWSYEHSADTSATPETVWPYFEDVAGWPIWNEGIEHIVLEGPFAPGTTFLMTPPGGADDSQPTRRRPRPRRPCAAW